MENSRKSTCSPVSEDSASQQDGQDSKQSPSVRTNPTAKKFSKRGSGDMLPTPSVEDAGRAGSAEAWRQYEEEGRTTQCRLRNKVASLSSPTSETSMGQNSEGQLSLPGVFPASRFLSPGSEEARRMTATSGRKCSESYRKPGQLGSLVRMLLESSTWHSNKCALTWKPKIMKSSRLLFQLQPSTPRTRGKESGLLHTPSEKEPGVKTERLVTKEGEPAKIGERAYDGETGRLAQVGLPQQITMLRTPDANMERGRRTKENMIKRYQVKGQPLCLNDQLRMVELGMLPTPSLKEMSGGIRTKWARPGGKFCGLRETLAMLPTPKAQNSTGAGQHGQGGEDLQTTMAMLPTPRAGTPGSRPNQKGGKILAEEVKKAGMLGTPTVDNWHGHRREDFREGREPTPSEAIGESPGLKLQPAFVEWMMGYPPGFTDIGSKGSRPSGTPSSPRSHTRSSRGSQK